MSKFWIIVGEVYRKNVKSWSFLFLVLSPIILALIGGGIGTFIAKEEENQSIGAIGLVSNNKDLIAHLQTSQDGNEYRSYQEDEEAQKDLANKRIEGYLLIEGQEEAVQVTYYRQPSSKEINLTAIEAQIASYYQKSLYTQAGIELSLVNQIQSLHYPIQTVNLSFDDEGNLEKEDSDSFKTRVRQIIAFIVCFIVFMFISSSIGIIAQEIASEKGSRIMEIILSSVSANTHFFGKMVGIGLVILTQMLCYIVIGVISIQFVLPYFMDSSGTEAIVTQVMQVLVDSKADLAIGLVFALLGVVIYAALGGFLGSLVTTTEDSSKAITPVTLMGVLGFYIGMYALSSPNNIVVQIASLFPFTTPFVMPQRIAKGSVSTGEIILSLVLMLALTAFSLMISAVFYKSNVLVTSDKGIFQTFKRSYNLWKSERKSQG